MDKQGIWQTICIVMATTVLTMARDHQCHQQIALEKNQTVHRDMKYLTSQHGDCVIEFSTKAGLRVVLTFSYVPSVTSDSVPEDCAYALDYLLIGNDVTAIGHELVMSYKFCRETEAEEIVSRDNSLWLVLRDSAQRKHRHLLSFNATALPQASCNAEEMQCSPVQCVAKSAVCDGHTDCDNGHDEYCYDFNLARRTSSLPTNKDQENHHSQPLHHNNYNHHHHQHRLRSPQERQLPQLPPEGSTCFLCRDGTCILPRPLRYDYNWGVWLWYLCDGVPHCPDGWDEQAYMCYLNRQFPQLAQSHLFQCQAFDVPPATSRQVTMWALARCDGRRDCREEEEEEEGEHLCDNMLGVTRSDRIDSGLYLNPPALTVVVLFVVIVIITAVFILRRFERLTGRTHSTQGRLAAIRQDVTGSSSHLPSCMAVKSCIIMDTTTLPSLNNKDLEPLRETSV